MEDGEISMKIAIPDDEKIPKLHEIQWQILKMMANSTESRFNEIKPEEMDPTQFSHHLNQLKKHQLVFHDQERGVYVLTERAKVLIAYFTDIPSWGNLPLHGGILLYVVREGKILTVTRDRQPFINHVGLLYSPTRHEQFVEESAKELMSETGLKGELELALIIEVLFTNKEKRVIRHGFMLNYASFEPNGELNERSYEGKLGWMSPKELLAAKPGYDNTKDVVEQMNGWKHGTGARHIAKTYQTEM